MDDQFKSILGVHNEAANRFRDPIARISDTACKPTDTWLQEIHISYAESQTFASMVSADPFDSEAAADRCSIFANQAENSLAAEKINQINKFPRSCHDALLIRGFQPDRNIPETPYEDVSCHRQFPLLTASILAIFGMMGIHPVAYAGEERSSYIRNISPYRQAEQSKSSHGSKIKLGFHVDNPHLPLASEPLKGVSACPEFLCLMGARCEPNAPTKIISLKSILAKMPDFLRDQLSAPDFAAKRPESFGESIQIASGLPLIAPDGDGGFLTRYNEASVRGQSPAVSFFLHLFSALIGAERPTDILLRPGDLILFKNQKVLHARDQFSPRYDGADRWMLRIFGISDISRIIPASTSQPFLGKS